MRVIRRQLRAWREDFQKIWGKLKTFHRTALGILIAISMVYGGRVQWIDPINTKIAEAQEALKESNPPDPIPTIETDDEVQETLAKIEGRKGTRDKRKKEMEAIIDSRPKVTLQNKERTWAEFTLLFSKNHLLLVSSAPFSDTPAATSAAPNSTRVRSTSRAKTAVKSQEKEVASENNQSPFPTEKYQFHLEGTFKNIHSFLEEAAKYPYPSKIDQIQLGLTLPEESDVKNRETNMDFTPISAAPAPGVAPKLQLKFHFTLYIQEVKTK
ncbi:MAG: hypothetical protein Q4C96_01990 [Planctomycetia bacterium]|nr:hypothetical protein [Planctomycetia bacterium]